MGSDEKEIKIGKLEYGAYLYGNIWDDQGSRKAPLVNILLSYYQTFYHKTEMFIEQNSS